ncbi:MAG: glycoside hydrolase family 5 protein [Labilithrix sp.]|nr:glycoside hydrolase family 5 protein [Labilithrix sp.]
MSASRALDTARGCALAALLLAVACGGPLGGASDAPPDSRASTTGAELPDDRTVPPRAGHVDLGREGDPSSAPPSRPPSSEPEAIPVPYRGVNLAGAEFGDVIPGSEGRDYKWPTSAEVDYFLAKGMNTFRVGFKWERLQPSAYGELTASYLAKLDALVGYATSKGARVVLNPHNFARYYGVLVGSADVPAAAFADLWRRLALLYADNPRVMFNLVNEPNNMPTEQWVVSANAAIAAVRAAGAGNVIHVPGNGWTGAHSWASSYYGTPNAQAMLDIVDPADNLLFEVHQYLDQDSGGKSDQCISKTIGRERLAGFIGWLRATGKRGFVGEFAGGDNPTCNAAIDDMLASMMEASDVLVGWLWWAAGPAWRKGYPFSLHPEGGQDKPQMKLLDPHLAATKSTL